jgi:hypothetical protein
MVLASSLTGFDVEFIDGVRGEEVVDKALPVVCLMFFVRMGGAYELFRA